MGNVDVSRLDQLNGTIKSGDVDVNTGETDKLLRRVGLSLDLKPPAGTPGAPDSLELHLQLNLADVNKPQTIQAPANAQPLDASALQQLGIDPSALGGALGGGLGSGGALPESGGSTQAPGQSATQAYQQCLSQASGVAALQRARPCSVSSRGGRSLSCRPCRSPHPRRRGAGGFRAPRAGPTCSRP